MPTRNYTYYDFTLSLCPTCLKRVWAKHFPGRTPTASRILLLFGFCLLLTERVVAQKKPLPTRQAVAGMAYSLIPPPEFTSATTFSGFQNKRLNASILLVELPTPASGAAAGFTAEALKSKGMTLLGKERVMVGGKPFPLFAVSQQAGGMTFLKQMLVWGDSSKTVLVTGTYPEKLKPLEYQIQAALISIQPTAQPATNPVATLLYRVDVTGTPFKLAQVMSGTSIYTTTGKMPSSGPALIVGNSLGPNAPTAPGEYESFSRTRLKKLPHGEMAQVIKASPMKVGELAGIELTAHSTDKDGNPSLIYQLMLFDGKGFYYMVVGTTIEKFDDYEATFRQVAKTFRRKA